MDFIVTNDLGHKLITQLIKIDNDVMKDLYVHFKWCCVRNSGYCPDFTLSNVDNIGPRLISGHDYKSALRDLDKLLKKQGDILEHWEFNAALYDEVMSDTAKTRDEIYRFERLCDGFGYKVYNFLKTYCVTNEVAKKVFIEKANDIAPSDCEVFHFRNFLSDCANYVGFYFMQVTDPQFCDDVLEHFQKCVPYLCDDASRNNWLTYSYLVQDLILYASMLYKCANRFGEVKYDGPDLVDEHKSFKVEAGDPKYPKGLYCTEIALKVFEAIR